MAEFLAGFVGPAAQLVEVGRGVEVVDAFLRVLVLVGQGFAADLVVGGDHLVALVGVEAGG